MKKTFCLLLIACLLLCGCGKSQDAPQAAEAPAQESSTSIFLQGESAEIRGGGARAEGSVVTVSTVGSYRLSGELNNGQIVVDTGEDAVDVTLILDGVTVSQFKLSVTLQLMDKEGLVLIILKFSFFLSKFLWMILYKLIIFHKFLLLYHHYLICHRTIYIYNNLYFLYVFDLLRN